MDLMISLAGKIILQKEYPLVQYSRFDFFFAGLYPQYDS